ncbi:MAG: hypothetical protein KDD63_13840 [Bacteroidetes bacterium]|nr:hypothetical protein [Bacteroidota bacterium]MCB0844338.1 hypothetical protein [Bacteroidota bacterium]MCB0853300.1 hypothetical protein [Bacteroidota bacterium]
MTSKYFLNSNLTRLIALVICLIFLRGIIFSQLYISKFVPGDPLNSQLKNHNHRIELFNESRNYIDISGYILITRHYVMKFSPGTYVGPMLSLRLGKIANDAGGELDKEFLNMEDYYQERNPDPQKEGDFAILLDGRLNLVDAFYFAPKGPVDFLPAMDSLPGPSGQMFRVMIPEETEPVWGSVRNRYDPAVVFIQINRKWHPDSYTQNLFPATDYRFVQAKFEDDIVTVKWRSLFERDCYLHVLGRSSDGKNFDVIRRVKGPMNSSEPTEFTHFDADVKKNRVYYYRVENIDKFGNQVQSNIIKVRTEEIFTGFFFDVIPTFKDGVKSLNVRFSVDKSQHIKVKLLDELLREIDILYNGTVEAKKQNLLNYTHQLPIGKYYVIVFTDEKRYYEPLVVD